MLQVIYIYIYIIEKIELAYGLTLMNLSVVSTGSYCWFWPVTIPVEGV